MADVGMRAQSRAQPILDRRCMGLFKGDGDGEGDASAAVVSAEQGGELSSQRASLRWEREGVSGRLGGGRGEVACVEAQRGFVEVEDERAIGGRLGVEAPAGGELDV